MRPLHPPLGRVGNEPRRVSGEGCWKTDRSAIHPPRRLVPRLRPSQREGEAHSAQTHLEGATAAPGQWTLFRPADRVATCSSVPTAVNSPSLQLAADASTDCCCTFAFEAAGVSTAEDRTAIKLMTNRDFAMASFVRNVEPT